MSPRQVRRLLSSGSAFVPAPFVDLPDEIRKYRNPVLLKIKLHESGGTNETTPSEDDYFNDNSVNDSMYFDY